jgi:hypothetical protein
MEEEVPLFSKQTKPPEIGSEEWVAAYRNRPIVSLEVFRLIAVEAMQDLGDSKLIGVRLTENSPAQFSNDLERAEAWKKAEDYYNQDCTKIENAIAVLGAIKVRVPFLQDFQLALELYLWSALHYLRSEYGSVRTLITGGSRSQSDDWEMACGTWIETNHKCREKMLRILEDQTRRLILGINPGDIPDLRYLFGG